MRSKVLASAENSDDTSSLFNRAEWYALHTRSRHERVAEELLRRKNIETFLPLRSFRRKWSDRIKSVEEPLFKGYLFVHTPLFRRVEILQTKGIVRFIGFEKFPAVVPERELVALKRFVEQDMIIDPFPYLKEGQRVVVKNGPFRGIEGLLVMKKNRYRLVISLDLISQSAAIEIDSACVEAA